MNTQARETGTATPGTATSGQNVALRAAVRTAEGVCALPAVATQDWCDRAAAALLPIVGSGVAITMIAQIDDRGTILRQEATGVAGAAVAEITTTVGRTASGVSTMAIDSNDAGLVRARTSLAQARELSWTPGALSTGQIKVGTPQGLAPTPAAQSVIARRWDAVQHGTILLGAATVGPAGRVLVVEIAPTGPGASGAHAAETELSVLEAVLPLLARRAIMAIGADPTEPAAWLTQREQIILQHLLLGKSVREIADELGRSPHTVHDHVKSLHRKLNASSRGELVARALGYVELKPTGGPSANASHGASKPSNAHSA